MLTNLITSSTNQIVDLMIGVPLWREVGNCLFNDVCNRVAPVALPYLLISPVLVPVNILVFSSVFIISSIPYTADKAIEMTVQVLAVAILIPVGIVYALGAAYV